MKRLIAAWMLLVAILASAGIASAHASSVVAAVSNQANEITVRVLDVYQAAVPGAKVTVAIGKSGKPVTLTEGPAGTYRGKLSLPTDDVEAQLVVLVGPDQFQGPVRLNGAKNSAEGLVPLVPIEPKQFSWGPILYGAAVVVLATATAFALMKKKQSGVEGE